MKNIYTILFGYVRKTLTLSYFQQNKIIPDKSTASLRSYKDIVIVSIP